MAIGTRRAKPVEVTVQSYGEDITLRLRPLSALEVDQLRNAYPDPTPPRTPEGALDDKDPEYMRQLLAWAQQFAALKLCRMIGSDEFGVDDPPSQIKLLKADYTEAEFFALVRVANSINAGEMTPEKLEAARAKLVPFASDQPPATSST